MYTVAYLVDTYIEIELCKTEDDLLNLLCSILYDDEIEDLDAAFSELEDTMSDDDDFYITIVDSRGKEIFKM